MPIIVKHKIDRNDANSDFYGKFALYRVGGTSTVVKKVNDIYLTSQRDGSPLSVDVAVSTNDIDVQVLSQYSLAAQHLKEAWWRETDAKEYTRIIKSSITYHLQL